MKNEIIRIGDVLERIALSIENKAVVTPEVQPNALRWTGESINLVELAYGIWLTGQLNNGNATISEIIRWMEASLGIHVGRAYRRWTEISRRDRVHSTKFIDRMKESIDERIRNGEGLQKGETKKERE
jgi:RteC protein.